MRTCRPVACVHSDGDGGREGEPLVCLVGWLVHSLACLVALKRLLHFTSASASHFGQCFPVPSQCGPCDVCWLGLTAGPVFFLSLSLQIKKRIYEIQSQLPRCPHSLQKCMRHQESLPTGTQHCPNHLVFHLNFKNQKEETCLQPP